LMSSFKNLFAPISLVPCHQTALYTLRLSDIDSHLDTAIDTIIFSRRAP
jgi:hypothetical protein